RTGRGIYAAGIDTQAGDGLRLRPAPRFSVSVLDVADGLEIDDIGVPARLDGNRRRAAVLGRGAAAGRVPERVHAVGRLTVHADGEITILGRINREALAVLSERIGTARTGGEHVEVGAVAGDYLIGELAVRKAAVRDRSAHVLGEVVGQIALT